MFNKISNPILPTTLLLLMFNNAWAHHSAQEAGLVGSMLHWLTDPSHLLLICSGAALAFVGHKILSKD